jgi:predicted YcjX-like family ATPase
MGYWAKHDLNANEDTTIPTRQIADIVADWMNDPDLAALSRAGLHNSRLALDYQLEVPQYRRFVDTGEWQDVAA